MAGKYNFTPSELTGGNFASAITKRTSVDPSASADTVRTEQAKGTPQPRSPQLRTSASASGSVNLSVSTRSVSSILQGAALYKPQGLALDQYNQLLSSDLQAVLSTAGGPDQVLGARKALTPYDVLVQQATSDGKINFDRNEGSNVPGSPAPSNHVPNSNFKGNGDGPSDYDDVLTDNGDGTFDYYHEVNKETYRLVKESGLLIAQDLAEGWKQMKAAATAEGITLTGSCFRSYERQIALRAEHGCPNQGDTCSVPTAWPGNSRHERGRAIDFAQYSFSWLSANAAEFGFKNLPSESWHWSDTGN